MLPPKIIHLILRVGAILHNAISIAIRMRMPIRQPRPFSAIRTHPKHRQRISRPTHHLDPHCLPLLLTQRRKHLTDPHMLSHQLLQSHNSITPQNPPYLHRAKPPPQRNLPVPIIRHKPRRGVRVLQIRRRDGKTLRQICARPHEHRRTIKVRQ